MNPVTYKVLIYPSAEHDLTEIREYFLYKLKISPNKHFEMFYKTIDTLETNPFLFPLLKDPFLNQLGYRMIPIDNFLLFYTFDNDTVQIHRFLYGRRNYLSIL